MKMKYCSLFILVFFLIGCQPEEKNPFAELEKSLKENYDPQVRKQLFDLYEKSISNNPEASDANLDIIYKKAMMLQSEKKYNASVDVLKEGFNKYYNGKNGQMNLLLLAGINMDKIEDKETALSLYQAFKLIYPTSDKNKEIQNIVDSAKQPLFERVTDMGKNIYNAEKGQIDFKLGKSFVKSADYLSLLLPKNKKATELLYLGAESAKNLKLTNLSLEMYDRILNVHPDSKKAGQAAFMKAFIYDSDLKQFDKAKELYEIFITKYPDNDFVDDAQALIQNLGKSEEELIQMFIDKNKKK